MNIDKIIREVRVVSEIVNQILSDGSTGTIEAEVRKLVKGQFPGTEKTEAAVAYYILGAMAIRLCVREAVQNGLPPEFMAGTLLKAYGDEAKEEIRRLRVKGDAA